MSTALITGGSGHVGANLVRELTKRDFNIKCIDFDGDHRAFEGYDVELIKGSITDIESIDTAFKNVDVVFHTAAVISLVRKDRDIIRSVNVAGTRNVCELSLRHGVKKLIHFSSVDAFVREPLDEALLEDRPLVTDSDAVPYDLSKADAQRIVYEYCEKGLDASIIHPSGIFGPNDFKPSLFGQEFINIANGKRPYTVNVGYDYVDVRDLCTTAINCIEKGESKQNYIVGGNYIDFVGIAEVISDKLNKQLIKKKNTEFKINNTEKTILEKMINNPGKVFSRIDIGNLIKIDKERSIDVIITRLRKKIEKNPKNPKYLQTIRGSGYVLWVE